MTKALIKDLNNFKEINIKQVEFWQYKYISQILKIFRKHSRAELAFIQLKMNGYLQQVNHYLLIFYWGKTQ